MLQGSKKAQAEPVTTQQKYVKRKRARSAVAADDAPALAKMKASSKIAEKRAKATGVSKRKPPNNTDDWPKGEANSSEQGTSRGVDTFESAKIESSCGVGDIVGRFFPGFGFFVGTVVSQRIVSSDVGVTPETRPPPPRKSTAAQFTAKDSGCTTLKDATAAHATTKKAQQPCRRKPNHGGSVQDFRAGNVFRHLRNELVLRQEEKKAEDEDASFDLSDDLKALSRHQPLHRKNGQQNGVLSGGVGGACCGGGGAGKLLYLVRFRDGDAEEYSLGEVLAMKASLADDKRGPKMTAQARKDHESDANLLVSIMATAAAATSSNFPSNSGGGGGEGGGGGGGGVALECVPQNPYKRTSLKAPASSMSSKKAGAAAVLQAARGVWAVAVFGTGAADSKLGRGSRGNGVLSPSACSSSSSSSCSSSSCSSPWERYERYKRCRTVGACLESGATPNDLVHDFERGSLRVKDVAFRRRFAALALRIRREANARSRNERARRQASTDSNCTTAAAVKELNAATSNTVRVPREAGSAQEEREDGSGGEDDDLECDFDFLGDAFGGMVPRPLTSYSTAHHRSHPLPSRRRGHRYPVFRAWLEESWEGARGFLQRRSDVHWCLLEHKYLGVCLHDIEEGQYDEHRVIVAIQFSALVQPPQWVVQTNLLLKPRATADRVSSSTFIATEPDEVKAVAESGASEEEGGGASYRRAGSSDDNTKDNGMEEYVINETLHSMIIRSDRNKHRRVLVRTPLPSINH